MPDLKVWYADKDGFYAGELEAFGAKDDLATLTRNAAKNGHKVIDATKPGAKRPPDRPGARRATKTDYDKASTPEAKLELLAKHLGLK